jgi:anti-sigma factor RsiW
MKPITESDLEQLSAYLDGELSDSERRFFQKRLCADPALREACERAWLASSVLKAQPFQLMPAGSAEQICAHCPAEPPSERQSWRWVASVAALALVLGVGYQLSRDEVSQMGAPQQARQTAPVSTLPGPVQSAPVIVSQAPKPKAVASTPSEAQAARPPVLAADDPTQFVLNDAVRSKTWPKSNQDIEGYLVRHNQISDAAAGSDLITYAQSISEPAAAPESRNSEQDEK